ncbi:MAG: glycoside hydrolase family 3 C-terminal domain-containing protein [Prevotella sp.]|nr:glycoside hydrolase family 3 C-terminal domain-containing protein [Prevotella sp.]
MRFPISLFLLALSVATNAQTAVYLDDSAPIEERIDDAMSRMTLHEKIAVLHAQSKFSSPGVKRLGFPDFWTSDGPHGIRPEVLWDEWDQAGQTNDSCVAFPALTCLAATWNTDLARLYGRSLGEEARYRGKDMVLGPGVNIYRTPLGGRNFEYMGEDPCLAATLVVPYIEGLQSTGTAACVKHFALNNDELNRHKVNVIVSDRALREIYLPAFEAAVKEGKVWGVMGSYNLYKNTHNCQNDILLNKILKGDWGFDGVVVSDWGGASDTDEAVYGGLDMEFGTWTDGLQTGATDAYDSYCLAKAYEDGIIAGKYSTKELDDKVRRVLRLFFRTTMATNRARGFMCSEAHYDAARQVAEEGIVLLKNKGDILPLNIEKTKRILVVGENAIKPMTVGGGSSSLKVQREISPLEGLKARLAGTDIEIDYQRGYTGGMTSEYNGVTMAADLSETRSSEQLVADAVDAAKGADYVIIFGGLNKDERQDCEGIDRETFDLPYNQQQLVLSLLAANKNIIFVNISGNAVKLDFADKIPAIVQGWYLGSEAGNALAAMLTGDVNPSGKLPFTWTKELADVGAHALNTYPGTWRADDEIIDEEYSEGIYVGYRWTDKQGIKPLFAFGHGLSYTSFQLSDLQLSSSTLAPSDTLTVSVKVKNTGKRAGAETVQLYISDNHSAVDRPEKELKGFGKVFLEPGEEQTVSIPISVRDLSYWDEATGGWKADDGAFTVLAGDASDHLPLRASFTLDGAE